MDVGSPSRAVAQGGWHQAYNLGPHVDGGALRHAVGVFARTTNKREVRPSRRQAQALEALTRLTAGVMQVIAGACP